MSLKQLFLVFIGGGFGSVLRYCIAQQIQYKNLPIATFFVNAIGSLFIGYLLFGTINQNNHLKLLLAVGFCGGFTTFSTFSVEVLQLIQQQKNFLALIYVLVSVITSVVFTYVGFYIANFKK